MDGVEAANSVAVVSKFLGVTERQALRVEALLRLGVSVGDVRVAESLMAPASTPGRAMEVEWLVGCTTEQMSYRKALEVLGVTQAMLEEERSKILGGLGVRTCNTSPAVFTSMEDVTELEDTCFSQYLRIQQLELQVAALIELSADK